MSTINDSADWVPAITEVAVTDPILGGSGGVINVQAKQLADRTAFLKQGLEATAGTAASAEGKASQALSQIAAAEDAAGGTAQNAAQALAHKNEALAAKALTEQARNAAQNAQQQAGESASYAYLALQTTQQKAQEATTAATTAVTAAGAAAQARDQFLGASATAAAAISTLADSKVQAVELAGTQALTPVTQARDATLAAAAQVTSQAAIATGAATTASSDRVLAQAAHAATEAAKATAEAARDAATVNADVYASTAAGLAAVADGVQFQVAAADGLSIQRYRRDSASVATAVGVAYPSKPAVDLVQADKYKIGANRFVNATFAKTPLGVINAGGEASAPAFPGGYTLIKSGAVGLTYPASSVVERPCKLLGTNRALQIQLIASAGAGSDYQLYQKFAIPKELEGDVTAVGRFAIVVEAEVSGSANIGAVGDLLDASNVYISTSLSTFRSVSAGGYTTLYFDIPINAANCREVHVKFRAQAAVGTTFSGKVWVAGMFFDFNRPAQLTFDQNLTERIADAVTGGATPIAAAAVAPVADRTLVLELAKAVTAPWLVGSNLVQNPLLTADAAGFTGTPSGFSSVSAGGAGVTPAPSRIAAVATPYGTNRAWESDHSYDGTLKTDKQLWVTLDIPEQYWGDTSLKLNFLYALKVTDARIGGISACNLLDASGSYLASGTLVKNSSDPASGLWGVVSYTASVSHASARKVSFCARPQALSTEGNFSGAKAWVTGVTAQWNGTALKAFDNNRDYRADQLAKVRDDVLRAELLAEIASATEKASPNLFDQYTDSGGNVLPLMPSTVIQTIGDSMTDANWAAVLAPKFSVARTCTNQGIGAETSTQILDRINGFDAYTVGTTWTPGTIRLRARRAIPPRTIDEAYRANWERYAEKIATPRFVEFFNASGLIGRSALQLSAATTFSGSTCSSAGHPFRNGDTVYAKTGTLPSGMYRYKPYYVRDVAANTYGLAEFVAGPAISFGSGSLTVLGDFYLDWAYTSQDTTITTKTTTDWGVCNQVIWMGRNDIGGVDSSADVLANIQAAVDAIKTFAKRFAVATVCLSTSDTPGSAGALEAAKINAGIAALYPDNILDIRAYLLTKGNGGATDNADIANGITPTSLRADDLHLNSTGNGYVADLAYAFFSTRGW